MLLDDIATGGRMCSPWMPFRRAIMADPFTIQFILTSKYLSV